MLQFQSPLTSRPPSSPGAGLSENKDSSRLQDAFGRLHEFFTRIIMASYQYDLVSRCGNNYITQLESFRAGIAKAKTGLAEKDITLAITALQKLIADLKPAVVQLVPFQRKIVDNPTYQAMTRMVNNGGRALKVGRGNFESYLLMAEWIIMHPIYANSLLNAMVFIQVHQKTHSDVYTHLFPVLRHLNTDDKKLVASISAANELMIKQHYYYKISPPQGTAVLTGLPLPRGATSDPVSFIEQPLGFSSRFYPIAKDCLQACLAALNKIEQASLVIEDYRHRVSVLTDKLSHIAGKSDQLTPPNDPEQCSRQLIDQQGQYQAKVNQLMQMEQKVAELERTLAEQTQAPVMSGLAASDLQQQTAFESKRLVKGHVLKERASPEQVSGEQAPKRRVSTESIPQHTSVLSQSSDQKMVLWSSTPAWQHNDDKNKGTKQLLESPKDEDKATDPSWANYFTGMLLTCQKFYEDHPIITRVAAFTAAASTVYYVAVVKKRPRISITASLWQIPKVLSGFIPSWAANPPTSYDRWIPAPPGPPS